MKTVTTVQENAGDIYEDAKTINEERAAAKEAAVVGFNRADSFMLFFVNNCPPDKPFG